MKCEVCHLNEAARSIKRTVEGDERELFVCDSCARTSPHVGTVPASLTDVLFSLGMQIDGMDKIEDQVCPSCGLSRNDVREKHRLGCPKCYEVFMADIRLFLSAQLSSMSSSGEHPKDHSEVQKLKAELEQAVAEERYEEAALICEKIRLAGVKPGSDEKHGAD